ncbi:MAG: hypothetical protein CLLPBCKN_004711 [Chroococcidiopsis cubana SAG 39.79]|nr:hypothetical protein [Chroococcidiopsis cubana SAG 39.79]
MRQALISTTLCVEGLICHHEPDVEFLQNKKRYHYL